MHKVRAVKSCSQRKLIWKSNTVELVYSGHAIKQTPCYNRHFLVEPTESQSNSHRKTLIQQTLVMADTIFWNHVNISFENYLSIADMPNVWGN